MDSMPDSTDNTSSENRGISSKICRTFIWNDSEYRKYLNSLKERRDIVDVERYLSLIQEGNDAVRTKNNAVKSNSNKRSRRFNRDYYRTCVSEGHRAICYKFMLSPLRAGIKLEESGGILHTFNYQRQLDGEMESGNPANWVSSTVEEDPSTFANELIAKGDLVLLTTTAGDSQATKAELNDPLKGCRYVAAMELASEPRIKKFCRKMFREKALLTTRPTAKGLHQIHAFHEYYGLQLIKEKPVSEHFRDEENEKRMDVMTPEDRESMIVELRKRERNSCLQYLRLMRAESSGDLHVELHLPTSVERDSDWYKHSVKKQESDLSDFMKVLEAVYLPPQGDKDEWMEERKKILRMALVQFLIPQFENELRIDLRNAAFDAGLDEVSKSLEQLAMEGPYRPNHLFAENRFVVPTGDLSIIGVCVGNGKEPTYLAFVSHTGECEDHTFIPSGANFSDHREGIVRFLLLNRPDAVVIGTSGHRMSSIMAQRLGECITEATEKWNNRRTQGEFEDDEDFLARENKLRNMVEEDHYNDEDEWRCNVDLVDDNISQLFGRSRVRGKKEFPDYQLNLKCAISIARYAQNPLAELCYAWSVATDMGFFGTELLHLNIHPLQRLVPTTRLLKHYERVLCKVVAAVGVDINAACAQDHLHGLLQFVPGFGPRKAHKLKQNCERSGGFIQSRRSLLAKNFVGPTVYNNAIAFLRICDKDLNHSPHPLDDTRLHPDVYTRNNWASKIAMDALDIRSSDMRSSTENNDNLDKTTLRDVMRDSQEEVRRLADTVKTEYVSANHAIDFCSWDPKLVHENVWQDKVGLLDLEMFAKMIEKNYGLGKWFSHLNMIIWEFRLPFADPRKPMEALTGEKKFRLLTGEDDMTLCPGKEVTGRVTRNTEYASIVKLDCDVDGVIPLRNLADGRVEIADDVVTKDSVITALITEVKKEHMKVELTLKESDFSKPANYWPRPKSLPEIDRCFDREAATFIEDERKLKREERLAALKLKSGNNENSTEVNAKHAKLGVVSRRACAHPAFRNSSHAEIENELKMAGESVVGQALIRPSSSKPDSLVAYWVVKAGENPKVVEILEEEKDTDASIGNKLKIKVSHPWLITFLL